MPTKALLALLAPLLLLSPACTCQPKASQRGASKAPVRTKQSKAPPTRGFVSIKAGSFVMGSTDQEQARYTNERVHKVTLTRSFEISAHEVTQAQFEALMGYNPSHFGECAKCPVESVSWHEVLAYTNALSTKAGLTACYSCAGAKAEVKCEVAAAFQGAKIYDCPGYRLPTDAEWEYAYRAGTTTPYYNGDSDPDTRVSCLKADPVAGAIGWYCNNANKRTHEVGQKKPNAWGLYDMAGNVWEWCHDEYLAVLDKDQVDPWGIPNSPMRVVRGGAWRYPSRGMRAACRAWYKPYYRGDRHGFRPARTL